MAGLLAADGRRLWRAWPWALLLGAGVLFRYSALALLPLPVIWALLHRDGRAALVLGAASAAPLALLLAHDLHAYGAPHLLAMTGFQSTANAPRDLFRKAAASLAMLGGAGVLPVLAWARPGRAAAGALVGAAIGAFAAWISGHGGLAAATTLLACAAGGASLGATLPAARQGRIERTEILLFLWIGGGLLFLLALRFAATRYLLPVLAPAVLVPLRQAGPRLLAVAGALSLALSALILYDDAQFARAQQALAEQVRRLGEAEGEAGLFAGHWGWQHHLEAARWTPIEEDAALPPDTLLAVDAAAWPQQPAAGCREVVARASIPAGLPLPRVHTRQGAASFHAFLLAGDPPLETYAPWGFGADPIDEMVVWRGCGEGAGLNGSPPG
jgi:hypothetical protein